MIVVKSSGCSSGDGFSTSYSTRYSDIENIISINGSGCAVKSRSIHLLKCLLTFLENSCPSHGGAGEKREH